MSDNIKHWTNIKLISGINLKTRKAHADLTKIYYYNTGANDVQYQRMHQILNLHVLLLYTCKIGVWRIVVGLKLFFLSHGSQVLSFMIRNRLTVCPHVRTRFFCMYNNVSIFWNGMSSAQYTIIITYVGHICLFLVIHSSKYCSIIDIVRLALQLLLSPNAGKIEIHLLQPSSYSYCFWVQVPTYLSWSSPNDFVSDYTTIIVPCSTSR